MDYQYCIEVQRESRDDDYVLHETFDKEMSEDEIIGYLKDNDYPYLPDYERLTFYQINKVKATTTEETTDTALTEAQEKSQIAEIAKASILNIAKNKKAYEDLRDEYAGITLPDFKDPEFKKTYKKITEGSGKLVKARTAADKLVKSELAILDEVKTMIKSAGEDLKAITADTEKEVKSLKETAETLIEDDKQEQLRQQEEKKQIRINSLYELGFKYKVGYYQLNELSIQDLQVIQYSEAQFEGFVSQAKVVYEAEQLRIAEETEAKRKEQEAADLKAEQERAEALKEQERLQAEAEARQKELDAANRERDIMRLERTEARLDALRARGFEGDLKLGYLAYDSKKWGTYKRVDAESIVDSTKSDWDDLIRAIDKWLIEIQTPKKPVPASIQAIVDQQPAPVNGTSVTFSVNDREELVKEFESVSVQSQSVGVMLKFDSAMPYIDTIVGKATLRIYVEQFIDEASNGLTKENVSASGSIGDQLLFLVIKPKA